MSKGGIRQDKCAMMIHFTRITKFLNQAFSTGSLGISHHTDAGAVTVLLQDGQPGLQVLTKGGAAGEEGLWHDVEAERGDLIINIGDVVQVWSNDRVGGHCL